MLPLSLNDLDPRIAQALCELQRVCEEQSVSLDGQFAIRLREADDLSEAEGKDSGLVVFDLATISSEAILRWK